MFVNAFFLELNAKFVILISDCRLRVSRRCPETVGLVASRRRCGEQPPRPPPRLEDTLALSRSLPLPVLRAASTLGEFRGRPIVM